MNRFFMVACFVIAPLFAGCLPQELVVWSPDGNRSAVISQNGDLYLCDEAGTLSPLALPPSLEHAVEKVAWLPDSKQLVLVAERSANSWDNAADVFEPQTRQRIIQIASKVQQELLVYEGEIDKFEPVSTSCQERDYIRLVLMYLRDHGNDDVRKKLAKSESIREMKVAISAIAICSSLNAKPQTRQITELAGENIYINVAPDGSAIAFTIENVIGSQTSLNVIADSANTMPKIVSENTSAFCDWTPDGHSLVFIQATGDINDAQFGAIATRRVRDDSGSILAELPEPQTHAGLVFSKDLQVRCMHDGTILFAAHDINLPCTTADLPQRASLYMINPARQAMLSPVFGRATYAEIPCDVRLFQLSPNREHIAVLSSDSEVTVVSLISGEVNIVQPIKAEGASRLMPTWRNDDELCFLSPVDGQETVENWQVVIWSLSKGSGRTISETWPSDVMRGFARSSDKH